MRIGEIESITRLSAGTIRYWEERGLVSFGRSENSYRDIPDETIALLEKIKLFRRLGIAIADIKLWRDNIISERELISARRLKLEEDSRSNLDQRKLCEELLGGFSDPSDIRDIFFTEIPEHPGKLSLGVDIGTTSVSAKLVSLETGEALHTYTLEHHAALSSDDPSVSKEASAPDAFAANAEKLLELSLGLVRSAVDSFPEIVAVGFTGQMHGIVCLDKAGNILSPLWTWQNQFGQRRLGDETVCEKIARLTSQNVPTGYGLSTYYALRESGALPEGTKSITTIADLAVMKLCRLKNPVSHPTNAASLGLFDINKQCFDKAALDALRIDPAILPQIAGDFEAVGEYRGIKVSASIGDNQAGVFGSLSCDGDLLLNIGTSGQVSFASNSPALLTDDPCCEVRPYFAGQFLHSGSTLCGGRAYSMLADLVSEILDGFGAGQPREKIYSFLNESAKRADGRLSVSTRFSGTRKDPSVTGLISNITTFDLNAAELAYGFLYGMVNELSMLCRELTGSEEIKKMRLIVSGNAMRKNPALRKIAGGIFGCEPLIPVQTEEAAFGAALYAAISAGAIEIDKAKKLILYGGNEK